MKRVARKGGPSYFVAGSRALPRADAEADAASGLQLMRQNGLHHWKAHGQRPHAALITGRHDRATPLSVAEAASARYRWPLQVDNANDDPSVEQPEALLCALHAVVGNPQR